MRIELPVRIPLAKTLIFALTLFVIQQIQHTGFAFSLLFFLFLVVANIAFNVGGGFSRVSGAYVFLFTMLTCGISVSWKAVLGEPADSHLLVPILDMQCYSVSILMLLLVILANRVITGQAKGIASRQVDYTLAGLGCLVFGQIQSALNSLGASGPGSAIGVLNQLSQFYPLAIILGTIGAIKDSRGRRAFSYSSGIAFVLLLIGGTLTFSKTGMYLPGLCWLVGASFMRFKLRAVHYIGMGVYIAFAVFAAPTIAGGRIMVRDGASTTERAQVVYYLISHLQEQRQQQLDSTADGIERVGHVGYYDNPQGLLERLSIISADDAFFDYTNRGNHIGYKPVIEAYENLIPHFILPDKPVPIGGNYYAHEIGGFLADADDTTGISFSPVAEAYHVDGWMGVCLLLPAIWLSLFVGADFLCGDLRRYPWGLLLVVIFAHAAAESLLGALIWLTGYGFLIVLFAILFCTEFAPVLGALLYGGQRRPAPLLSRRQIA